MDVPSLADLLHETAQQHDAYEQVAPPHDWWDWYAAYLSARQQGSPRQSAAASADAYMADAKGVVANRG